MELRKPLLLRQPPPSRWLGIAVVAGSVALTNGAVYVLRGVAPAVSLGVVFLLAVMLVSTFWGFRLGLLTALASAITFNFLHIPPLHTFTIAEAQNWVALGVFFATAAIASTLAGLARGRAEEAEERRREADLMAELARTLLGGPSLESALPAASERLASALGLRSAEIARDDATAAAGRRGLPLSHAGARVGTLIVPGAIEDSDLERIELRVVPGLEALLAAALDREELLRGTVETEALRRSDELKTALLRSVSHDLRTPITAIRAAAEALGSPTIDDADRTELESAITEDAERLDNLVANLLDMTRLRTGTAEPSRDWCSLEEVIDAAVDELGLERQRFQLTIDPNLPLIRADSAQLERAFVNLLSNAARHSGAERVSVRAREVSGKLVIRVVDRGPGIPQHELDRIFEPFYTGEGESEHPGSGLGLAIVKGFVEANGGGVWAESLPGQGSTFVVQFPLGRPVSGRPIGAEERAPASR